MLHDNQKKKHDYFFSYLASFTFLNITILDIEGGLYYGKTKGISYSYRRYFKEERDVNCN